MRIELVTADPDQTRAVGEALADLFRPRDAVALTGELGAGKTTLVQGVARGLGVVDQIVSPTFMLVREYRGDDLDVAHVDVYRLDRVQDVVDLGLDELGDGDALLLVEWGDAVEALLPPEHLVIELTTTAAGGDDARAIAVTPVGPSWDARAERLEAVLSPWSRP
jgi:tRNA threonylcarbamoyladenosine biosynthesis protein TsaE